jgi:hypothetical protein
MGSKLAGRRMDSASSLPLGSAPTGRRSFASAFSTGTRPYPAACASHGGGQQLAAAVNGAAGHAAAAAAGAAAGAAGLQWQPSAGVSIDPAKYHNWEPQTSLLELGTTLNETRDNDDQSQPRQQPQQPQPLLQQQQQQGVSGGQAGGLLAPADVHGAPAAAADSGPLGGVSLGTWQAPSGGLWMSGSLAPGSGGLPFVQQAQAQQHPALQQQQQQWPQHQQQTLAQLRPQPQPYNVLQQPQQQPLQQQHATQRPSQPQQTQQGTQEQVLAGAGAGAGAGAAWVGAGAGARPGTGSGDVSSSGVYVAHSESSYGLDGSTAGSELTDGTASTPPAAAAKSGVPQA